MAVRKFKPVTPGQRNKVISSFTEITTKKPHKDLTASANSVPDMQSIAISRS